ncbi:hypothetical protein V8F20_000711 [Naviculisporaceae sp. PSN 640]
MQKSCMITTSMISQRGSANMTPFLATHEGARAKVKPLQTEQQHGQIPDEFLIILEDVGTDGSCSRTLRFILPPLQAFIPFSARRTNPDGQRSLKYFSHIYNVSTHLIWANICILKGVCMSRRPACFLVLPCPSLAPSPGPRRSLSPTPAHPRFWHPKAPVPFVLLGFPSLSVGPYCIYPAPCSPSDVFFSGRVRVCVRS